MEIENQRTTLKYIISKFVAARDAENLSPGTLRFYNQKLANFEQYCDGHGHPEILSIKEGVVRDYLVWLKGDHTPGGVHAFFRAVHALFRWYEEEFEPEAWRNPMTRIKAPKVPDEILDPVSEATVTALLKTCGGDYYGLRDRAIITLLDSTGLRASELLMLDLVVIDLPLSVLYVEHGKGGYPRAVDFDRDTKKALRAYLRVRPACDTESVFVNRYLERLNYDGLRAMLARRAKLAGVAPAMLHAFRRKHALDLHRAGESDLTIQRRLGHRDDKTLKRYIKLTRDDMRKSARRKRKR